jgi:hypothetical protein
MLSEKKISYKGNNGDYFDDLSKSFSDMYDSFKLNRPPTPANPANPENSIQKQVGDFAKSATDILGNTFNLNPDPFANPNPLPNPENPIQQNVSNALSQGLMQPQQAPSIQAPGIQAPDIFPKELSFESASKSLMDAVEEPVKSFSGVFSSKSDNSPKIAESSTLETIITIILLFVFLILIGIYAMQYFYGIDIVAKIKNIFTNHPEVEIKVEKEPEPEKKDAVDNDVSQILKKPQVFNIPENNYIYGDAQAVCKAYGARLATYQEVEEAYNKGAEWCNYGWSEGQMALFPTQQKTFDELQKIEGHENDCGRPGVNGGFIDNPKLRYGVNCYGYKPRINKIEKEMMETSSIYPKTEKDIAMDKRVEYWKERLSEIIVSPFNHDKWSKI